MKNKVALITGITGQDGSYLAEFLLKKDYIVHGIKRRSSSFNTERIDDIYQDPHVKKRNFFLHFGDLSDGSSLAEIIKKCQPDEIYNLGAQSHVSVSFDIPEYTTDINAMGILRILEIVRNSKELKKTKIYQASTSELYGLVRETPQSEKTSFYPRSPYGVAKLYAYWICKNYREAYGIFVCNGILFNHESKRRGETFVTRKITRGLTNIAIGLDKCLYLGNLDAKRDWGHAKDFVEMQWLMLQQKKPKDYVISTGIQSSIREFVNKSCAKLGIKIKWTGRGLKETAVVTKVDKELSPKISTGDIIIKVDKKYFRPSEVQELLGDSSKARRELKWKPSITLDQLVSEMIDNDYKRAKNELIIANLK